MHKIALSKEAKLVLRLLDKEIRQCPANMPQYTFTRGALELRRKGLAYAHQEAGGEVVVARINDEGRAYLVNNPSLRNPIDWRWIISLAVGIATLLISLASLFVACASLA